MEHTEKDVSWGGVGEADRSEGQSQRRREERGDEVPRGQPRSWLVLTHPKHVAFEDR